MPKTGTVKHTHQYFRRPDKMWACSGIEGCTHYMPKNMYPAPVGRLSLCWDCMKEFQLTPFNMENEKPMCDKCMEAYAVRDKYLEKLGLDEPTPFFKPVPRELYMPEKKEAAPKTMEDVIEVYEADEAHSSECEIYVGGDCTCK